MIPSDFMKFVRVVPKGENVQYLDACGCSHCLYAKAWKVAAKAMDFGEPKSSNVLGFWEYDPVDDFLYEIFGPYHAFSIPNDHWIVGPHAEALLKAKIIQMRG